MKHIVGFSGGIDSQACARWVLNRYPAEDVILLNSDAGENEHPLTTEFIAWYSANVHAVITVSAIVSDVWETPGFAETKGLDGNAPLDFGMLLKLKGRPVASMARYCTTILKLKPQRRWICENFGPSGQYADCDFERYTGVRRSESEARKDTPYREWDSFFDCWLNNPLCEWLKEKCFEFVQAHGERVNELYRLGFGRVGCAPCALCAKEDIANWAIRSPEMIDKIRRWEQNSGVTFFQPIRVGKGKQINRVDEVVAWAKTSRGGRQSLLPIMHERPACESKYGLCE